MGHQCLLPPLISPSGDQHYDVVCGLPMLQKAIKRLNISVLPGCKPVISAVLAALSDRANEWHGGSSTKGKSVLTTQSALLSGNCSKEKNCKAHYRQR